jgi:hypothetical protein
VPLAHRAPSEYDLAPQSVHGAISVRCLDRVVHLSLELIAILESFRTPNELSGISDGEHIPANAAAMRTLQMLAHESTQTHRDLGERRMVLRQRAANAELLDDPARALPRRRR